MSLIEGSKVSYIGDPTEELDIGDTGKLLVSDGHASHVRWLTGASEGEISLVPDDQLVMVAVEPRSSYYDSLDGGRLVHVAIRNVFDRFGQVGLLNALNDEGHLSTFQPIAEEAIAMVASRIREDPSFVEVLGELDGDEGDEFVMYASFTLLKDAFGEEED